MWWAEGGVFNIGQVLDTEEFFGLGDSSGGKGGGAELSSTTWSASRFVLLLLSSVVA